MSVFGNSRQPSAPQQQQSQPMNAPSFANQNINGKSVDVEFGKHVLKVDELELTFYKIFAGWRSVTEEDEVTAFKTTKVFEREKYIVDYDSRMTNEQGANHILQNVQPLIIAAVQSSKLREMTIYNNWKAKLISLRMSMLDSYYFPKMRCKSCKFNTSKYNEMHYHIKNTQHRGYRKIINPYELDIDRLPEMMGIVANLHTITYSAVDGFKMKEITENYVNSNNGMSPQQMQQLNQPRGIMDIFRPRI